VLAIGFLLVILSSALWKNYLPLLVVGTYIIAPIPNWLCGRAANQDDFMESSGGAVVDFGRFMTGFLVVMGIGMFRPNNSITLSLQPEVAFLANPFPDSFTRSVRSLLPYCIPGNGHVNYWRLAHLRHDYQFHYVFSRGTGFLGMKVFGLCCTIQC